MNNQPLKIPGSNSASQQTNPFARALAELEKQGGGPDSGEAATNPFADALSHSGGDFGSMLDDMDNPFANPASSLSPAEIQKKQLEEAAKQRLRRQLHDRVNPVDAQDVFNARHEQVAREIDKLRADLKALAKDISSFHKEIDITLMSAVSDVGEQGKYYLNFFQKLRAFIMMLRQHIQSARTWMQQSQMKKAKKKARGAAPGMVVDGNAHEQTQTIFDTMHHERSSTYGGS